MSKDYYKVLGVDKSASKEEIKKAYKKLAKKYHPDISQEADAEVKFKEINEAAGVLLDDDKKQRYDTYGSSDGPQGFGGFGGGGGFNPQDFGINLDDIFEQFGFGGFGGGGFSSHSNSRRQQKDTSLYSDLEISLDDVYFGVEKELKINREGECQECDGIGTKNKKDVETCSQCSGKGFVIETKASFLGMIRSQSVCPKCRGSGEIIKNPCSKCHGNGTQKEKETVNVKIPKGIQNGVTLRVSGKGSYDKDSQSYGDLYLKIYVSKNNKYDVDDSDLYMSLDVNFVQAILGDEIDFEHFDKTLSLKIPEGTQAGTILRLKGKGLPHFNYNGNGDLYIKVNVEIPTKTSKEQKKILLDYAKTLKDKSLMERMKDLFK